MSGVLGGFLDNLNMSQLSLKLGLLSLTQLLCLAALGSTMVET